MEPPFSPTLFALLLFFGMFALLEVGRHLAVKRRLGLDAEKGDLGTIETAVFALFGLLIAFTFSGSASRFQEKRMMIIDEANAIETAYMRVDLVIPEAQQALRQQLHQYVALRLKTYSRLPDIRAARFDIAMSEELQHQMWTAAMTATRLSHDRPGSVLLLPALNDMILKTRTRWISLQNHPPVIVYWLLFVLGLLSALMAGVRLGTREKRSWLHVVIFPLVTACVVYITIDVEYPRIGFIRLDQADEALVDVQARMERSPDITDRVAVRARHLATP